MLDTCKQLSAGRAAVPDDVVVIRRRVEAGENELCSSIPPGFRDQLGDILARH